MTSGGARAAEEAQRADPSRLRWDVKSGGATINVNGGCRRDDLNAPPGIAMPHNLATLGPREC